MKKIIRLSETDLKRIVKRIISESTANTLDGREYEITQYGTIKIKNKNNELVNVRLTTNMGDINLKSIYKVGDGYKVVTKNGTTKEVDSDYIKKLISFADKGTPNKIGTGFLTPTIILKKV
jgi:hypothetical protein